MDQIFEKNFISTKDAAELSGYTPDYLSRLARLGKISGQRVGHTWFINKESLSRFLDQQGDRKVTYARELARAREKEYLLHQISRQEAEQRSLLNRATKVFSSPFPAPEKLKVVADSLRPHALALSLSFAVIVFGAIAAQTTVIPLARHVAEISTDTAEGFRDTFGSIPQDIFARIEKANDDTRSVSKKLARTRLISSENFIVPTLASVDVSGLRMAIGHDRDARVAPLRSTPALLIEPITFEIARAGAVDAFAFLTNPTRIADSLARAYRATGARVYDAIVASFSSYASLVADTGTQSLSLAVAARDTLALAPQFVSAINLALGHAIIGATHAAIRADTMVAYGLADAAPKSARATVTLLGETGNSVALATSRVPAFAAGFFLRATEAPSHIAPAIASAVFNAEYTVSVRFVKDTQAISNNYLRTLHTAGRLSFESSLVLRELGETGPAALQDAYLGALGKSALALESFARAPKVAAVISTTREATAPLRAAVAPALSIGEQAALATYTGIRGFFDSANHALAILLGPAPTIVLPSPPPRRSPPIVTSTSRTTNTQRQSIYNSNPTYTTVVSGVSEDFVNQSLASLRSDILATAAGMIRPVYMQTVTNAATTQQVNLIQDLSNLIVRNGDFRGSTFDSGIRVTATGGNFTNLTGGTTTLATTTFTHTAILTPLATAAGTFLAVDGSGTIIATTTPSGGSGSGTVGSGTTGQLPYYAADGTTLTATSSLFLAASGKIGVGTTSPYSLLSLSNNLNTAANTPLFTIASTTGGTSTSTLMTVLANGNIGVGTTTPGSLLSLGGTGANTINISATATSTFGSGINVLTGCFAVNGTCVGGGSGGVGSGTTGQLPYYAADGTTLTATSSLFLAASGNVGIGTTTPFARLAIEGFAGNSNNLFLVSTTTDSAATSTAFRIDASGRLSFGSVFGFSDTPVKLANPTDLPAGTGQGTAFSPDGQYLSVAHQTSPYVTIYKRSGDTFTKLADPSTLPLFSGTGVAFSPDGQYLSVSHLTSPFVTIYKRSGDTFTKLANPATLPASTGNGTAFSPDGQYLSVAHNTTPFVTIYKRSGDTFTKLANPATLPAFTGNSVAFSPDGQYLSVAHVTTPFITIYKRSGDTFTKLADPATLPASDSYSAAFSPDGQYLSVAHDTTPFITIYKRSGDTFTKLADPATLPAGAGRDVAFSPDGQYLSVAHSASPRVTVYKRSGDTFTKLADPATLPAGNGSGIAFSPDGQYLSVAHDTTPFVTIYKGSGGAIHRTELSYGGVGATTSPNSRYDGLGFGKELSLYRSGPGTLGLAAGGSLDIEFGQLRFGGQPIIDSSLNGYLTSLGIGTTSPYATLSVVGQVVGNYFTATSTTQASTFPYASTTALTISGTSGLQIATGLNGPLQANAGLVSATSSVGVLYGGTGLTSVSDGQLLFGSGGTTALTALATSTGGFLSNSYTTGRPSWVATSSLNVALSNTTGTLPVDRGGTGATTFTAGQLLYGNGTAALSSAATSSLTATGLLSISNSPSIIGASGAVVTLPVTKGYFVVGDDAGVAQATSTVFISSLGNVGIGSTSPFSLLSVDGSSAGLGTGSIPVSIKAQSGILVNMFEVMKDTGVVQFSVNRFGNASFTNGMNGTGSAGTCPACGIFLTSGSASNNGFVHKNAASQTGDPLRILNNDSTSLLTITPLGKLIVGTSTTPSWLAVQAGGATAYGDLSPLFDVASTTSSSYATSSVFRINANGNIGIGTTTPNWLLQAAGTRPSLALSDTSASANLKHWLFSSMGGNLYVGTSTDAYGTSTPAALSISNAGALTLASALGVGSGGTGLTSITDGQLLFGSGGTTALTALATSTGGFLSNSYTTGRPSWVATSSLNIALSNTTGTLSVDRGGTGATTFTAGQLLYGNGTAALSSVATSSLTATGLLSISNSPSIIGSSGAVVTLPVTKGYFVVGDDAGVAQATSTVFISSLGNVGIGTTTPNWLLQAAGTRPSLALSDTSASANLKHWLFSSMGGNLYVGTSTDAYGTSTPAALSISNAGALTLASALGVASGGTGQTTFTAGQLLYGNGTNALSSAATTTLTGNNGLTLSAGAGALVGGSNATIGLAAIAANSVLGNSTGASGVPSAIATSSLFQNASASASGLLTSADWTTFNNKQATISATWPITLTGATLGFNGLSTSTAAVVGNIPYFSGANTFANVATSSLTATGLLSISNSPSIIGASGAVVTLPVTKGYFVVGSDAGVAQATSTVFISSLGNVGIGTTTPWAQLSVHANNGSINNTLFAVASSTATATTTLFSVDNTGLTTIGASSGTGDANFQFASDSNAWSVGYNSTDKSFNIASSTSFSSNVVFTISKGASVNNVGIGTTSPYAKLSLVDNNGTSLRDVFAISTSTSGLIFKVDSYGATFADGAYTGTGADYAEYFYTNSVGLKPGEVVCVDILENNAVKRCERGADNNVMGIVSAKPSIIGNYTKAAMANPSRYAVIGMLGQVDAYVSAENGPISVGDSLTSASSTPGVAMRADGGDSTVGIALEPISAGTGKIKVLISRRNKSLAVEEVETLVVERIAAMEIEDSVQLMIKRSVDNLNLDPKITAIAQDEAGKLNALLTIGINDNTAAIAKLQEDVAALDALTAKITGAIRIDDTGSLDIMGDIAAKGFVVRVDNQGQTLNPNPQGLTLVATSTDAAPLPPEVLTADGGGVDLYKFATYNLASARELAAKLDVQNIRLTALETRVDALESGAISSVSDFPLSLSSSTLASALSGLGVFIQRGVAQFSTLVADRFVAATNSAGTSSAGTVTILAGNTVALVENAYVLPSSKIFITFTASTTGSWHISDKQVGSFKIILSEAQSADTSFDYFLVQTEGQVATSTPSNAAVNVNDHTPPVITLLGDNPVRLSVGGEFVEPGVVITDDTDPSTAFEVGGSLHYTTFVNGIEAPDVVSAVDTGSEATYIITYSAADRRGNSATATRAVIVGGNAPESTPEPTPEPSPEPPVPSEVEGEPAPTPEPEPTPVESTPAPEPIPEPTPEPVLQEVSQEEQSPEPPVPSEVEGAPESVAQPEPLPQE